LDFHFSPKERRCGVAFRDSQKDGKAQLPKHRDNLFYNTDGCVGPPALKARTFSFTFNREDDIMLVQFFLKKIAANPQVFSRPFFPPKEHSVMTVDGKHGPITQAWIEKWQVHLHNIGRPVHRDGLVDRCQGGRDVSTKTNTVYSLMMMNVAFGQVTGEGGWDTWWKADEVPGLLKASVRAPETFL